MASVNKVIIVGNLGKDPEVRFMPSGEPVANLSIATTSSYKNKQGEKVEETEWHRVSIFGKLAEIAGEYLAKGRTVYIEGKLKTRKYTDKDGVEKFSTDIVASEMQMLGNRSQEAAPAPKQDKAGQWKAGAPKPMTRQERDFDDLDSVPF